MGYSGSGTHSMAGTLKGCYCWYFVEGIKVHEKRPVAVLSPPLRKMNLSHRAIVWLLANGACPGSYLEMQTWGSASGTWIALLLILGWGRALTGLCYEQDSQGYLCTAALVPSANRYPTQRWPWVFQMTVVTTLASQTFLSRGDWEWAGGLCNGLG